MLNEQTTLPCLLLGMDTGSVPSSNELSEFIYNGYSIVAGHLLPEPQKKYAHEQATLQFLLFRMKTVSFLLSKSSVLTRNSIDSSTRRVVPPHVVPHLCARQWHRHQSWCCPMPPPVCSRYIAPHDSTQIVLVPLRYLRTAHSYSARGSGIVTRAGSL